MDHHFSEDKREKRRGQNGRALFCETNFPRIFGSLRSAGSEKWGQRSLTVAARKEVAGVAERPRIQAGGRAVTGE